jgi:DNA-binding Lrp family transcriptional regulator
MLYSFPIGTSTVQVDVSDGLQQTIIDVILSNGRVYINQLARLVNASQREVYYAVSDLRKA